MRRGAVRRWSRRPLASAGFSLIEVLVVMIIIGILCGIAIPLYLGQRDRAKNSAAMAGGREITIALLSCVTASDADDPWPDACNVTTLSEFISADDWPRNAWSGERAMAQVAEVSLGDYAYRPVFGTTSPQRYELVVYLCDRDPFVLP